MFGKQTVNNYKTGRFLNCIQLIVIVEVLESVRWNIIPFKNKTYLYNVMSQDLH